jgi:hypothetical protein
VPSRHALRQHRPTLAGPRHADEARRPHRTARGKRLSEGRNSSRTTRSSTTREPQQHATSRALLHVGRHACQKRIPPWRRSSTHACTAVTSPPHIDLAATPQRSCPSKPRSPPPPLLVRSTLAAVVCPHAHTQGRTHMTERKAHTRNDDSADVHESPPPPPPVKATHSTRMRGAAAMWSTRQGA